MTGFYLVYVSLVMCLSAISMYFFIIAYYLAVIWLVVVVDNGVIANLGTNSIIMDLSWEIT